MTARPLYLWMAFWGRGSNFGDVGLGGASGSFSSHAVLCAHSWEAFPELWSRTDFSRLISISVNALPPGKTNV